MLTGISGSKIVDSTSTICGCSSRVLTGLRRSMIERAVAPAFEGTCGASSVRAACSSTSLMILSVIAAGPAYSGFCRHDLVLRFNRGTKRVPGESRAFDARRVVADTFEHGQLAQPFWMDERVVISGHHLVKLFKQVLGLAQCLTLDAVGHHRGRRFRNRA